MDTIRISGGTPLHGRIPVGGAKNAALPLMAASLLTDEPLVLSQVPLLADIRTMQALLAQHGVEVHMNAAAHTLSLNAATITSTVAPYDIVRKMRASFLVLGPLLARFGEASVSLPGGCALGARPVDLHLKGLEALGAEVRLEEGYIHAKAPRGLAGAEFTFPVVTVMGTENVMMAAALAQGTTRLLNAAQEPEITDLARCLQTMGARIEGAGTSTLVIHGVSRLGGATHTVIPDRLEAGSYAVAAAITGGQILVAGEGLAPLLGAFLEALRRMGVGVEEKPEGLLVTGGQPLKPLDVCTAPFPGFATDLQPQLMALMTQAHGRSTFTETIFENRFMAAPELVRMGGRIDVEQDQAVIHGPTPLKGAPVMASDIRASMALVLAALAARGETVINRVYHLDRGYEGVEGRLQACGATIRRTPS
jgi:UDP-N-acetylglucosamine 1-carboxyvinyltransferase